MLSFEFEIRPCQCVLNVNLYIVSEILETGLWFPPGTLSFLHQQDCHRDVIKILVKVSLNTHKATIETDMRIKR